MRPFFFKSKEFYVKCQVHNYFSKLQIRFNFSKIIACSPEKYIAKSTKRTGKKLCFFLF